jgi:hypothetical protein
MNVKTEINNKITLLDKNLSHRSEVSKNTSSTRIIQTAIVPTDNNKNYLNKSSYSDSSFHSEKIKIIETEIQARVKKVNDEM